MEKNTINKQTERTELNESMQEPKTKVNVEINENTNDVPDIDKETVFLTKNFNLWYGDNHALKDINLDIKEHEVTAIIGPSGCGKSTYVKALNRMVELVPIVRTEGDILYKDQNIFDKNYSKERLRTNVGMVFQKPNPFPKSIYDLSLIHI